MKTVTTSVWRRERLGLIMIAASLVVIAVITGLLFKYQQTSRLSQLRSQGVSLVRLLSGMAYDQLVPASDARGPLQVMSQSQNNPDFAYGVVSDPGGNLLAETTAPGVIVTAKALSATPGAWIGERASYLDDGRRILEFHAPVMRDNALAGYIRLGYVEPGLGPDLKQIPFLATLALPIFLLTPLFYFLVKREVRPLRELNGELKNAVESGRFHRVELNASGELGSFMERFNNFMEFAQNRIHALESDQSSLVTSTKLLSYRRARIENVLQALPDMVLVLDETGAVSFTNDKLLPLLGAERDEVVGYFPKDWCREPQILAFLSRCIGKTGSGYVNDSLIFAPDNAPEKSVEVKAFPLFSPKDQGTVLGTLVVFRDVTEEVLAKRSRGEFVAHVAHELKTPLNVLAMYSEALQGEEGREPAFQVEACNVISDEVERLGGLIGNLLSMTEIEMGTIVMDTQRAKLKELLEDAFENVSRSGRGQGLDFQLDLPKELSAVSVDKDLLRIAINNLLTNAIKYNRPGGSVVLSAEEFDDAVMIRVRDTGVGIQPQDQDRIFEKFYRSSADEVQERSGHGLGLSLTQQIVHMHHGKLSVESTPGQGTEFTIELRREAMLLQQAV